METTGNNIMEFENFDERALIKEFEDCEDFAERALITAVIKKAVEDAKEGYYDAEHFLTSELIDPYLILLDIDPDYFKYNYKKISFT